MTIMKKSLLGKNSAKSVKPAAATSVKATSTSKLVSPKMVTARTIQTTKSTLRTTRVMN